MVRGSNFKSFCMVALLFAEAIQAVTPDIASVTSIRLFQIVEAIAERGESRTTPRLHEGCLTTHTEKSPPPNGSVPFEDRSEESAPDEVCLASFQLASQLPVNEAGYSHKSQLVPFDPDMLSVHSGRLDSSYVSDPIPWSCALIHSLCRMTC
ncbi:MAG: hypothetical protein ACLQU5_20630 [Isosphaeraceae bacterium]